MIETRNTTVTLTAGTEKAVEFAAAYNYFYIKNDSSAPLYVSMLPNIAAGADGVFSCAAGESIGTMHGYPANKLYLLGEGTVQVCGVGSADNPFKIGARGGDSYVHPTASGYKHIPSGGTVGQILKNTADGTADWVDLQIGGTNLLLNSAFIGTANWGGADTTTVSAASGVLKITPSSKGGTGIYTKINRIYGNTTADKYTLTFMAKSDADRSIVVALTGYNSNNVAVYTSPYHTLYTTTEWQTYTVAFDNTNSDVVSFALSFMSSPANTTPFYIKYPMLARGTEVTDWSPSPYDVPLSVQKGTVTTGSDGTASVTFPKAFSYTPNVQVTPRDDGNEGGTTASILSVSTTSFKVKANKTTNASVAVAVDWIAVEV